MKVLFVDCSFRVEPAYYDQVIIYLYNRKLGWEISTVVIGVERFTVNHAFYIWGTLRYLRASMDHQLLTELLND